MTLKMEPIKRFLLQPQRSFFLFGPRGTGKSTWTKMTFPNALRIDLLAPEIFRSYSAKPERLRELLDGNPNQQTVVIDEIQKVPDLLPQIHQLIEEKRGWQFVLTGSSSRKLKRTGADLLAGRALLYTLHPFMAAELGDSFNFEESLKYGTLPLAIDSNDPQHVLKTYSALYLQEEVQMEGLVRHIGNFSRFLEIVSFSHAAVLNISNIARECQIERKVVAGYIAILEDLLLAFRLPIFTKRAKRAMAQHPKFYLFDAGVFRSLRPAGPLDRSTEIDGAALEGLVAEHLRAWIAYQESGVYRLYFWRTRSGSEVDFVLYGPAGLWAIEVKNSTILHPQDYFALHSFKKDYPESKTLLLYRGRERIMRHGILCLPCEEFLRCLRPNKKIQAED